MPNIEAILRRIIGRMKKVLDLIINSGVMLIPIGIAFLFLSFQITDKIISILLFAMSYFFIIAGVIVLFIAFYRAREDENERKEQIKTLTDNLQSIREDIRKLVDKDKGNGNSKQNNL